MSRFKKSIEVEQEVFEELFSFLNKMREAARVEQNEVFFGRTSTVPSIETAFANYDNALQICKKLKEQKEKNSRKRRVKK
jgi:hypothetical protein